MHEMYKTPDASCLCQGDLIDFERVKPALEGHQDYIAQQKHFLGFCVLTQTCDLVQSPRVAFINLAVIRRLVDTFYDADVRTSRDRDRTAELIRQIINHLENKRGYFYLHREPLAGINEECVVDLRVMICLYTPLHYDQIFGARMGALSDVYANKLGWMAGHLFSRVPTKDWDELGMAEPSKARVNSWIEVFKDISKPELP
jgi:hypothetical protein